MADKNEKPIVPDAGEELNDDNLEKVAGGFTWHDPQPPKETGEPSPFFQ